MPEKILILGSSGKTGKRICDHLDQMAADYRAVSRSSPVRFDWEDKSTWSVALTDVTSLYLLHPQAGAPEAVKQIAEFAGAAENAGVERAVMISVPDDKTEFTSSARNAEQAVRDAGLALTVLRLRWFYQNFSEGFLAPDVQAGVIRAPAGEGRESFVDADDIAAVAAAVLTKEVHSDEIYELTGPRLLSFFDVAREISNECGRGVTYIPVSADEYVSEQVSRGLDRSDAQSMANVFAVIADSRIEYVTSDVEKILDRPARDFGDFLAKLHGKI